MTTPKWTEDRTRILTAMVEGMDTISQSTVASASVELDTTTRSISSKLRKMGYDVELAASAHKKAFSDDQADAFLHLLQVTQVSTLTLTSLLTLKAVHLLLSKYKVKSYLWN